jgi:hypothetical protein
MAQIKLLKIGTDGLQEEFDSASDEITLLSFTVDGGGPALSGTGLDMNDTAVSEASDLSFADPTTDGITRTDGTHAADDIMMQDAENTLSPADAAILFGTATDTADQVDAFRLPTIAGAPTATPADGGEGYLIWDSTNDRLFAWDGTAWDDLSTVDAAQQIRNTYTAGEDITAAEVVYISAADTVSLADAATNYEAIGVASTTATSTNPVEVVSEGVLSGFTGLTAGTRYFLAATPGAVTTTAPTGAGNRVFQIGFAKNTTDMHLQIAFVGRRAS